MKRLSMVGAVLAIVGAMQSSAAAAPVQIDFNVAGFGPTPGTTSSFTKDTNVFGDVDLTFTSMNSSLQQANLLYWDAGDGNGFADGFGVMGSGSYEDDEVEGDERLGLSFSRGVNLLGFNLTDFFNEQTPSFNLCAANGSTPNCYREVGFFMVQFGDGTSSGWMDMLAYADSNLTGNGTFSIAMNFDNVTGLLFRAPGQVPNNNLLAPFVERHEFSLAGVRIDETVPVPEPASMTLVALGLSGIVASRRRRRTAA
jgi:hypothetical protein